MELNELEVYRMAREVGMLGWKIYSELSFEDKRVFGYQFITAVDSIAANIAEGHGRFHYLDRNKFNYNSRGSLLESIHWLEVMRERNKIKEEQFREITEKLSILKMKLNRHIASTKDQIKK